MWWDYERTRAIEVDDGIKATKKRLTSWVSERWITFISGFFIGARFNRGKTYANKGQVVDITIEPGLVRAKVQGSMRKPYEIKIEFQTLGKNSWEKIAYRLRGDTLLCAQVLSAGGSDNAFPQELERIFESEGTSLFPKFENDSSMSCSCPDKSVPCKHLVAVFILLGEAFERDPFLILKLRGISREKFFAMLGIKDEQNKIAEKIELETLEIEKLEGEIPTFPIPDAPQIGYPVKILEELGAFPFWKGRDGIEKKLAPVYARASEYASSLISRGTP